MRATGCVLVTALSVGCGSEPGVRTRLEPPYPERLGEWRLFVGAPAALDGNAGVVPYDLNTALFSDYALKHRTLWMPPGAAARYVADGVLDFPEGTIFSKTFYYAAGELLGDAGAGRERRLVETRLLFRNASGWVALPYVWNDEQTEAVLEIAGDEKPLRWRAASGAATEFHYVVPNLDECASCHVTETGSERRLRPVGPTARNLNRDYAYTDGARNQLARWSELGSLVGAPAPEQAPRLPAWDDAASGSLEARARAYLEVQCAHCHGRSGPASPSALYLDYDETRSDRLGLCKTPVAAGRGSGGRRYDVVPGRPEESILLFRMVSREPDVRMPELGRNLRHEEGVELVRRWIEALPGACEAEGPSAD